MVHVGCLNTFGDEELLGLPVNIVHIKLYRHVIHLKSTILKICHVICLLVFIITEFYVGPQFQNYARFNFFNILGAVFVRVREWHHCVMIYQWW